MWQNESFSLGSLENEAPPPPLPAFLLPRLALLSWRENYCGLLTSSYLSRAPHGESAVGFRA